MKEPCLVPIPKFMSKKMGQMFAPVVFGKNTPSAILTPLKSIWSEALEMQKEGTISFEIDSSKPAEAYHMEISEQHIHISGGKMAGVFYACMTLKQLALIYPKGIPCFEIEDEPEFPIRGVLLDISRSKIPSMETLLAQIDTLALLKINHLELYIEGFSFAYPGLERLWKGNKTPITPKELKYISDYCTNRFIDLVPCQNSLGHMNAWLEDDAYASLAECPGGFEVMGNKRPATTLDPTNPATLSFVTELTDHLLESVTSKYFNVCLDEPFELGYGKNKERAANEGTDNIYINYAKQLNEMLKKRNKTMLMWGDMIASHKGMAQSLPKDIIVLDWGYESEHPVESRAATLHKAGLRFCLCPGTNSWSSFTGITDNMLDCIRHASSAARRYDAEGIIVTDWGDMGHLQYQPFSWPGLLFAAGCAWGDEPSEEMLCSALNLFVFNDKSNLLGKFLLDAGRYYQKEEFLLPCRTLAHYMLGISSSKQQDYESAVKFSVMINNQVLDSSVSQPYEISFNNTKKLDETAILNYLKMLEITLSHASPIDAQVKEECENALEMIRICTRIRGIIFGIDDGAGIQDEINKMIEKHRILWLNRNRLGGLNEGCNLLKHLSILATT